MCLRFFKKFDATSNPAIVHHCMLAYKMAPVSLFIHEKHHLEKGLLPPAKDTFATAIRLIKPECLVHSCVDQVFLYP